MGKRQQIIHNYYEHDKLKKVKIIKYILTTCRKKNCLKKDVTLLQNASFIELLYEIKHRIHHILDLNISYNENVDIKIEHLLKNKLLKLVYISIQTIELNNNKLWYKKNNTKSDETITIPNTLYPLYCDTNSLINKQTNNTSILGSSTLSTSITSYLSEKIYPIKLNTLSIISKSMHMQCDSSNKFNAFDKNGEFNKCDKRDEFNKYDKRDKFNKCTKNNLKIIQPALNFVPLASNIESIDDDYNYDDINFVPPTPNFDSINDDYNDINFIPSASNDDDNYKYDDINVIPPTPNVESINNDNYNYSDINFIPPTPKFDSINDCDNYDYNYNDINFVTHTPNFDSDINNNDDNYNYSDINYVPTTPNFDSNINNDDIDNYNDNNNYDK
jgi:hypothetical protein